MSSELPRWKEYRIRQEIYREYLKHAETQTERVDSVDETDLPSPDSHPAGQAGFNATT
jgi:hypothetical protein